MFSEAISSIWLCWRPLSLPIAAKISASTELRRSLKKRAVSGRFGMSSSIFQMSRVPGQQDIVLAPFGLTKLGNAPDMTLATLEGRRHEGGKAVFRSLYTEEAAAENQDVRVVMLARQARRQAVVTKRRADDAVAVGGD